MTAIDFLTILRRRWLVLLIGAVLGAVGGYLTTLSSGDDLQRYRGTHTITVGSDVVVGTAESGGGGDQDNASQLAVLINRGPVPRGADERLDYPGSATELADQIDVQADDDLATIEVSYVHDDPERAAQVANAFADEFVEYVTTRAAQANQAALGTTQEDLDRIQARIAELDATLGAPVPIDPTVITAERDALVNQYRVVYERFQQLAAVPPESSTVQSLQPAVGVAVDSGLALPDNTLIRMFITGGAGLLLGAAIALALEGIDIRIRDKDQAERAFGLPVITEVPAMPRGYHGELVTSAEGSVPLLEAYRELRTVLALHDVSDRAEDGRPDADDQSTDRDGQVVVVVSPGPGEGKTVTAAHLAVGFAELGRTVLVLDCDFHRPRLAEVFGIDEGVGLRDALTRTAGRELAHVIHPTGVEGVSLAPSGQAVGDPARLLAHGPALLETARKHADVVIVDTPPMRTVSDAIGLVGLADAVLVVCRVGRTTRTAAERTREALDLVEARVLGVVLAAVRQRGRGYYGYYREHSRVVPGRRERHQPAEPDEDEPSEPEGAETPNGDGEAGRTEDTPADAGPGSSHRALLGQALGAHGVAGTQPASGRLGPVPRVGRGRVWRPPPPGGLGTPNATIAFLTFVGVAGVLLAVGSTVGVLAAETWTALIVAAVLLAITALIASSVARWDDDPWLARILMVGLVAKLFGATVKYFAATDAAFSFRSDSNRYFNEGLNLAESFSQGDFSVPGSLTGTRFVEVVSGIVYTVLPPSRLAGFFVFAFIGYLGLFAFTRAFRVAFPDAPPRRYDLLVLFLPSLLFWPSSIGKEAWMTLTIGVTAYGVARVLSRRRWGFPILAFGLLGTTVVRPHVTLLLALAILVAYPTRRVTGRSPTTPVWQVLGFATLILIALVVASQAQNYFGLSSLNPDEVDTVLAESETRSAQGGSEFSGERVASVTDVPGALVTVPFRPLPWEADNWWQIFAALEGALLLGLVLAALPRFARLPRDMLRYPYLTFAAVYTLGFVVAFSTVNNFGILVRQRVQLFPLLLVLIMPLAARTRDDA